MDCQRARNTKIKMPRCELPDSCRPPSALPAAAELLRLGGRRCIFVDRGFRNSGSTGNGEEVARSPASLRN
jgi:hypothetical protein